MKAEDEATRVARQSAEQERASKSLQADLDAKAKREAEAVQKEVRVFFTISKKGKNLNPKIPNKNCKEGRGKGAGAGREGAKCGLARGSFLVDGIPSPLSFPTPSSLMSLLTRRSSPPPPHVTHLFCLRCIASASNDTEGSRCR